MKTITRLGSAAVLATAIATMAVVPAFAQQTAKLAAPSQAARATEAPLRKFITDIEKGTPDYATMVTQLADAVRNSMPASGKRITDLGPLKSLTYTETGPRGMDIYRATFEKGALTFRIALGADGIIQGLMMSPAQ